MRQAISCAIDRDLIIRTLLRGHARPAVSLLPPTHWAWTADVPHFDYDPARAEQLLDEAGYPAGANGVRFHLTMKTSTVEDVRSLAAVLQQQLAQVGIALDFRTFEFATFYADVTRGAFQLYSLRWIGGNEQPDIFSTHSRQRVSLPRAPIAATIRIPNSMRCSKMDQPAQIRSKRRADYVEAQQILAQELPAINLWYKDTIVVHNRRLTSVTPTASGSFAFLETAELRP